MNDFECKELRDPETDAVKTDLAARDSIKREEIRDFCTWSEKTATALIPGIAMRRLRQTVTGRYERIQI